MWVRFGEHLHLCARISVVGKWASKLTSNVFSFTWSCQREWVIIGVHSRPNNIWAGTSDDNIIRWHSSSFCGSSTERATAREKDSGNDYDDDEDGTLVYSTMITMIQIFNDMRMARAHTRHAITKRRYQCVYSNELTIKS